MIRFLNDTQVIRKQITPSALAQRSGSSIFKLFVLMFKTLDQARDVFFGQIAAVLESRDISAIPAVLLLLLQLLTPISPVVRKNIVSELLVHSLIVFGRCLRNAIIKASTPELMDIRCTLEMVFRALMLIHNRNFAVDKKCNKYI